MYTGTELFNMSIAIIDELSDTGTINDSQVKEYKNRAPYLLDLWQGEEEFENTEEYSLTNDSIGQWVKFDLPADFGSVKEILFLDADSQPGDIQHKQFSKTEIYFYCEQAGTLKLLYKTIPAKITSLTQSIPCDEIKARRAAYYLAEHFYRADQNDTAADRSASKFSKMKDSQIKEQSTNSEIIDVYA